MLLHLARQMYPDIPAVFIDTKSCENITWLKPAKTFKQVINDYIRGARNGSKYAHLKLQGLNGDGTVSKYKQPFKISERCCDILKKHPAKLYEKQTGRKPIVGTMVSDSSNRRTRYLRDGGCNSFDNHRPISKPLSVWTTNDILRYIKTFNIPYCPIYGDIQEHTAGSYQTGQEQRTGCMFCAFGAHLDKQPTRFTPRFTITISTTSVCQKFSTS